MSQQKLDYALIGLCAAILVVMVIGVLVLVMRFRSKSDSTQVSAEAFKDAVKDSLKQLKEESQHFVAVNAVLALTEHFEQNPELIQNLEGYTDQVAAAALTYRVNSLGQQLKTAMDQLKRTRELQGVRGGYYDSDVERMEGIVRHLQQELESVRSNVRRLFVVD